MKSAPYLLAAASLLAAPPSALACGVCGLDGDPGFVWSIAFLMSMPFAVAGAIGGVFLYSSRRGRRPAGTTFLR